MNFKITKKFLSAIILVLLSQTVSLAVDDVWGGMGLTDDAVQYNNDYANTVFDKYTNYTDSKTSDYSQGKYPTDLSSKSASGSTIDKEKRTIKDIEFYGLNSISQQELMDKMQMKQGSEYSKELMQTDLKAIYETGYFTEKMKAIPSVNGDGTVTIKIVVEENIPVKDFTIEGNTVVPTEDILATFSGMKGKPQNIGQINQAISQIQELYNSKGYILARVDSVTDDPDGTINVSIKEGIIDKIM